MKDSQGNNIKCRATGKVCYTQHEANLVIASCRKTFKSKGGRRHNNGGRVPKRMYLCEFCKWYHLTSHAKVKKIFRDINSFTKNY